MAHDLIELAAYVAQELPADRRAALERHLALCEDCATEAQLADRGRELAGLAREAAPARLHYRVAALVNQRRRWPRLPTAMAVAAAAAAVLAGAVATVAVPAGAPAAISAAAAEFRARRLPGDVAPATPAPDLTALGWSLAAGGVGQLAGRDVTAYAYRDREGRRLLVYTSGQAFTTPAQAREYGGDGAWVTRLGAVSVLCGRAPHRTMVVGLDEKQVAAAAQYLKLT